MKLRSEIAKESRASKINHTQPNIKGMADNQPYEVFFSKHSSKFKNIF